MNVSVKINLDGMGIADSTPEFLSSITCWTKQIACHGLFNVHSRATGDLHIDDHHANEDVALAIGMDLSGRPHLSFDLQLPTQMVGTYDTQLVDHFFQSLVNTSGMTLHIWQDSNSDMEEHGDGGLETSTSRKPNVVKKESVVKDQPLFKRKKAPNPLSLLKKKIRPNVNPVSEMDGETRSRSRKRKRSKKGKNPPHTEAEVA